MVFWIKRFAGILGWMSFFIALLTGIDFANPFAMTSAIPALLRGIGGALFFWFAGFIIGDIMFKGIVEDVAGQEDDELEGGILQRISEYQRSGSQESDAEQGAAQTKENAAKSG